MLKIDFENTYTPKNVASDFSSILFDSFDSNEKPLEIKVIIQMHPDQLLPNVYNLAFGVPDAKGNIDDEEQIKHFDTNKMFSTVLLSGYIFLQNHPNATIGIDGSNDVRAYWYHRMINTNKNYLTQFFTILGVDWYVRLMRDGQVELDSNKAPFFKPKPEAFNHSRPTADLYRYYMFHLK